MNADCLLCLEVEGKIPLPGGVYETPTSVAFHLPEQPSGDVLLGHHLVVPKRHVHDHGGLDENEAEDIGRITRVLSRALSAAGAQRVYVFSVGHSWPHLHVHLVPRWPSVPEEVPWHAVKDEPGSHRVDFATAASFAERVRWNLGDFNP
ncbi:HIT family protein [Rhodococcus sp. 114MFTsu3.1]|uniref:HIT family protein n=1 Tax=Rhodococcus sp. 114MFTsu3.1 TaxID=1172184 RepID=UPI0003760F54|nr:HIT family protein [Rhodococcus sp. 114MFTsu3.1]